jgi:hypothetical protein
LGSALSQTATNATDTRCICQTPPAASFRRFREECVPDCCHKDGILTLVSLEIVVVKYDDLDPILPVNLRPGFKDLVTVACTSLNYVEQLLPGIASRVLDFSMKLELAPAPVVVLRIEARAHSGRNPVRATARWVAGSILMSLSFE